MLPARRPTTPRCLGPRSFSSIEWQAWHPWYSVLPWAASPLGAASAEAGVAPTIEAVARNALTTRSLMLSMFRFIGLPSCLLEDKTAAEADLFPLGHQWALFTCRLLPMQHDCRRCESTTSACAPHRLRGTGLCVASCPCR